MEPSSSSSSSSINLRRKNQERESDEFNLKEWGFKARISRENTMSRRFSASYITSFREDHHTKSFRSNFTISSTASSPGYHLKDEIDPSTYSFTTALKALQARSVYSWECMSPDGFALHSKWYEAEKYISNPLSGEVPMECLSAKTLSGRSFRNLTSRITMSAPLIYPSQTTTRQMPTTFIKSSSISHNQDLANSPIQEKKVEGMMTKDVGTQSTPPDMSGTSSPSIISTPPIKERAINRGEAKVDESPVFENNVLKSEEKPVVKETRKKEDETKKKKMMINKKVDQNCKCTTTRQTGCFSLTTLWCTKRTNRHRGHHHTEEEEKNIAAMTRPDRILNLT